MGWAGLGWGVVSCYPKKKAKLGGLASGLDSYQELNILNIIRF